MKTNNNLLIITSAFPNNLHEYEWIFIKEQLKFIKKEFDNIYVIRPQYYINSKLDFFNLLPSTWKEKPIRQDYVIDNIYVFFPKISILWFIKNFQIKEFIEKKKIKFDVIHSHFIYPSWEIGNYLKKIYNKPHIITWHWFDVYNLPFRNIFWKYKIKKILKQADVITTVSKSNANKLGLLWFDNIKIIPNWFDEKNFCYIENKNRLKKELNIPLNKKILLTVWNLISIKNQKTLILACKELLKKRKDFICYIIWNWPLKNELQKLINENNLQDYVKLLWQKKTEKVARYMNAADLFVFPSLSESFWVVQIESMACGTPIVATINWWSEEIVTSEDYGVLMKEKNNTVLLANKINKWLEKQWNKKKIINYVKNNFSYKKILSSYIDLYENINYTL